MAKETYRSFNIDSGDEIVISGIAGRFPDSINIIQLQENLFNKVDLLRDHGRWDIKHPDVPKRIGAINDVEKFDADFFNLSFNQAHTLEPMARMLLEHTYEAIFDAGINPKQLRGKNTAVIIGASFLDTQEKFLYQNLQIDGLGCVGCSKSTIANMLSYSLNLKGPSYTVDTACSSSLYAMALGYREIMSGRCEDAIIGTSHLCLHPTLHVQFSRFGVLSSDGSCKPFDATANGYSRSETVSVLYLQKSRNAKRIYATCKHIKLNSDGYKKEGITFPSTRVQGILLEEFYNECGISSSCLDYIEAHGTGTRVGDPVEINAIYNVLCKDRKTPLMIGSVKSNLGHAEPASGFTQIAKVIIAFETGVVPPNINYTSPRDDIEPLVNGSIRVITKEMPLKNGYIGINSFGFGGSNAHMLLKWNTKQKVINKAANDGLSRLVTLSGRTEESVNAFLNDIASHSTDAEYIRLIHDIYSDNIEDHPWRGYIILDTLQQNSIREIQNVENVKRPVWFIFSGLGTQWPRMGENLLKFDAFANAVKMCDSILKSYDINIIHILTNQDGCKSALHAFVGIVAVQIGLVDLLTSLGITADYMISHSVSELGCAYADKCLTVEQTILSAYFIGLTCIEENIIHSSMAIVNLDYECLKNICPADIQIICYNSQNSNIVTGPAEFLKKFVKKLQINNIKVKEIPCEIPYHSRYLASVKAQLLINLNRVITQPKKRSSRWISTSIPLNEWSDKTSKLSSANYHTCSILNTVLFEQATNLIPNNAVIIEIAPDSLLEHILKESLHPKVTNISLIRRTEENPIDIILRGIGKLYNCGLQPQIARLYPPIEFPVSRSTPMISPSIKWNHSEDWFVPSYQSQTYIQTRERHIEVKLSDDNYDYMIGHVIDGRNLLPAIGYLALVWETIGMMKGILYTTIPIVFRDISFIRATHLSNVINLTISIQKDSGKFEIIEGDSVLVKGTAHIVTNPEEEMIPANLLPDDDDEEEHMTARDIYKELKLRGYQYSGLFRGLKSSTVSCKRGRSVWEYNWVTFMDTMLQLYILGYDTRDLYVPTSIEKLVIDPALHTSTLHNMVTEQDKQLAVRIYKDVDAIISGGVEIRGVKATAISRRKLIQNPILEEYLFVAHHDRANVSLIEAIRISAQLALEDHPIIKVKAVELVDDIDDVSLEDLSSLSLIEILNNIPLIQANITILTSSNHFDPEKLPQNVTIGNLNKSSVDDKVLIAVGFNLLTKQNSLKRILSYVREGGYLLTREKCNVIIDYDKYLRQYELNVIFEKRTETEIIVLLKRKVQIKQTTVVRINNDNFNWLEELKSIVNEYQFDKNSRIIIVGEGECGLLGFVNCLRKEPGGELVRGVLIQDPEAPQFSLQNPFYTKQLQKDMSINVLRSNKTWGSYRHLKLSCGEAKPVRAACVRQMVRGDLSTFCWTENDISTDTHLEDLIHVVYSSINFKDVMLATAKLNTPATAIMQGQFQRTSLGIEYVGFDINRQRVMGLGDDKCIANVVVRDKDLCWNIPDTWTFEEAATVPCVYSTCYLALYLYGKMKKGDKILIHSGTGGVGQAAIHLALSEGCEVFTTVGTSEKREFIKKTFPTIADEHIGNSRDTSFEQMIMSRTNGRGVDIVLNSLAEEKLIASVRCLARGGRFLEIGKFDIVSNNPLDIIVFQKGISVHGILFENMFADHHKLKSLLSKMMANGLKNGVIKPLWVKVFPKTEIETAFRYMSSGKHIGKIILKIQDENQLLNELVAHRRYYCPSDKSYIIVGGLGGFGLELTDWLIQRGARNVVLVSRTGMKNGYQRRKVELWKSYGVNVLIVKNINVANRDDCERLLRTAGKEAPVDAIFNLAMVLKDNTLKNQTKDSFAESFKSKAWATQMLDELSRKICPNLRHFVAFSSLACGKGNAEQTNYGMANSVMERVCEKRTRDGLPGLAIQWGVVGDVGIVADMREENKELVIGGTLQQKISNCLDVLDAFLLQNRPVVSSMVVAEKKAGSSGLGNVVKTIANILNVKDLKKLGQNTSLAELGMDSMMVVEIKQILERDFDIFLSVQEVRNLTFVKLNEISSANANSDNTHVEKSSDTKKLNLKLFGLVKDEDFTTDVCLDFPAKIEENTIQVFLIPGLDGCANAFNYLVSNIKFSMTLLQCTINDINAVNVISETTDHLTKHASSRLKGGKDFVIVGYSFGSIIAIELARRLEAMNFKGRLVLIDGAPEQTRIMHQHFIPNNSEAELQIYILNIIMKIYNVETDEKILMEELKKCKTWKERLDIFAKHFLAINTLLSSINLKTLCTTVYKHSVAIRQYDSSTLSRIKSPITLLKPTLSYAYEIGEDYDLHKVTQNKVEVHYITGDHITILRNDKVAVAINGEVL